MTYWQFHLVFIVPALLLLALVPPRPLAGEARRKSLFYLVLIAAIAFVYTTPWDNYLVYRGVWGYGTARVLGVIGYVPIEEYAFFLLQPFLTGLWFYRRLKQPPRIVSIDFVWQPRVVGGLFWAVVSVAGYFLLREDPGVYLGLILVWAGPVLAGQCAYAGHTLWSWRRPVLWGIAIPTFYLWIADRIAIGLGIWEISERYTLGRHLLGLPVEEAVFFLVTNVLVVQGLVLFEGGNA